MTRVLKFGGSSLADPDRLREAAERVRVALPHAPLVVLSACGKTTDRLLALARTAVAGDEARAVAEARALFDEHRRSARQCLGLSVDAPGDALPEPLAEALAAGEDELATRLRGMALLGEASARSLDALAAQGELASTRVFVALLLHLGLEAEWFDVRTILRTNGQHGAARPDTRALREAAAALLAPRLGAGRAVVTQGFLGRAADGATTTLGRGGSDYSAALLGAALAADEVQIWTDVEGVLSADPRVVARPIPVPELSFAEAAELAAFGAKVLHPATIQPAVEARVPVTVRHTARPDGRFTTIHPERASGRPATALASRGPIAVVTVTSTRMLAASGFLAKLFEVFGRHEVPVDLVATAEVSVSMTVEGNAPLDALRADLEAFASVEIVRDRAIVAIVGERLKRTSGLAARVFTALAEVNIELVSMGANEVNLSLVVPCAEADDVVRKLHRALFEGGDSDAARAASDQPGRF